MGLVSLSTFPHCSGARTVCNAGSTTSIKFPLINDLLLYLSGPVQWLRSESDYPHFGVDPDFLCAQAQHDRRIGFRLHDAGENDHHIVHGIRRVDPNMRYPNLEWTSIRLIDSPRTNTEDQIFKPAKSLDFTYIVNFVLLNELIPVIWAATNASVWEKWSRITRFGDQTLSNKQDREIIS